MSKRPLLDWHSLTVQMVLSFTALVLLAATAVGLPAIVLIRNQIERQAWAQVGQGSQATEALYTAAQNGIDDLATLTAQRPTLKQLLRHGDRVLLGEYVRTLRAGTELDLLLVCSAGGALMAGEQLVPGWETCDMPGETAIHILADGAEPQVWLLAPEIVEDEAGVSGQILVGIALDARFVAQLKEQTGLEHTLFANDQPVASSISGGIANLIQGVRSAGEAAGANISGAAELTLNEQRYYVSRSATATPGFVYEVALNVTETVAAEQRLVGLLAGSILVVALAGSALGALIARQVGRPLTRLADAADVFSTGDLSKSVHVNAQVREVNQLAQALENARRDLQESLVELRRAKEWSDSLLESIYEGIVTLDRDGAVTFFSAGAERIIGLGQAAALGQHCDQVFRAAEADELFSRNLPPPGLQVKSDVLLADGRVITLALTGARLLPPESDEAEIALVFRDVSEAEMVHHFMGEFLANITHEFRTPVSALAASTELLLDQADDLSPTELRDLINSLAMGIVGLQTLVDNLLESARLEAGRFRVYPRRVELGEIIADATRIMHPLLNRHSQGLVVELPAAIPVVAADSRRVTQVLVNLLSNANKYSPDHTDITISVTANGDRARLAVADRGPGISSEFRPSLFRRFVHPEPGAGKSRYGAGLGLSVVKAIVEAHGGEVGVDDRPDGGSVFWFTLPIKDGS